MGEQTAVRRQQDNDKAAAQLAEQQNASRVFAADVTTRHPDTGEVVSFKEGDTAPDWATTTLGAANFQNAGSPAPERKLGPVPGSGQFYAAVEESSSKTSTKRTSTES